MYTYICHNSYRKILFMSLSPLILLTRHWVLLHVLWFFPFSCCCSLSLPLWFDCNGCFLCSKDRDPKCFGLRFSTCQWFCFTWLFYSFFLSSNSYSEIFGQGLSLWNCEEGGGSAFSIFSSCLVMKNCCWIFKCVYVQDSLPFFTLFPEKNKMQTYIFFFVGFLPLIFEKERKKIELMRPKVFSFHVKNLDKTLNCL